MAGKMRLRQPSIVKAPPNSKYIYSVADPGFDISGGVDFVNGGGGGGVENH